MNSNLTLLLILLAPLFHTPLRAQDHVYDDLLVMYVDEDYEKCIWKAGRYMEKDDTRRDALPYLYASMCYHEMSKLDKYTADPEYKNAHRDALKYAVKFRKKDKNNEFVNNYEDYWTELNTTAMGAGLAHLDLGEYSKAKREFDRMTGYQPENAGAWQMLAITQLNMRLARDAAESMKSFREADAAIPDISRLPVDQKRILRESLIRYADHLADAGMRDSARTVVGLGEDYFSENPEFKALVKDLN